MSQKPWYLSKTLWTNIIMGVLVYVLPENLAGPLKSPEVVAGIFSGINFVLRIVTKDKLTIS
jgi:hypothetical protein